MTNYEMVEKLSEKMGVTMDEAKTALEASDWDMLDAALLLEKEHGIEGGTYTTRQARKQAEEEPSHRGGHWAVKRLGHYVRKLLLIGNRNRFEVRRRNSDDLVLDMPTTAMVLLLIFAFWVCVPLLVIGLFSGFRYSFSGAELGRESINRAMDRAAEAADRMKDDMTKPDNEDKSID